MPAHNGPDSLLREYLNAPWHDKRVKVQDSLLWTGVIYQHTFGGHDLLTGWIYHTTCQKEAWVLGPSCGAPFFTLSCLTPGLAVRLLGVPVVCWKLKLHFHFLPEQVSIEEINFDVKRRRWRKRKPQSWEKFLGHSCVAIDCLSCNRL